MTEYICGAGLLKVQCVGEDGKPLLDKAGNREIRTVAKGQPVPEAATWSAHIVKAHIRTGHLLVKGEEERPGFTSRNAPARPATVTASAPQKASSASASPAPSNSSGSGASGAGGTEAPSAEGIKSAQPGKPNRR